MANRFSRGPRQLVQFQPTSVQELLTPVVMAQTRYDNTQAAINDAINKYSEISVRKEDAERKNQLIEEMQSGIDELSQKYSGDLARAANEITGRISQARTNPFWNQAGQLYKQSEEARQLQSKLRAEGRPVYDIGTAAGQSIYDVENDRLRDDLTYDVRGFEKTYRPFQEQYVNNIKASDLGNNWKQVMAQMNVDPNTPLPNLIQTMETSGIRISPQMRQELTQAYLNSGKGQEELQLKQLSGMSEQDALAAINNEMESVFKEVEYTNTKYGSINNKTWNQSIENRKLQRKAMLAKSAKQGKVEEPETPNFVTDAGRSRTVDLMNGEDVSHINKVDKNSRNRLFNIYDNEGHNSAILKDKPLPQNPYQEALFDRLGEQFTGFGANLAFRDIDGAQSMDQDGAEKLVMDMAEEMLLSEGFLDENGNPLYEKYGGRLTYARENKNDPVVYVGGEELNNYYQTIGQIRDEQMPYYNQLKEWYGKPGEGKGYDAEEEFEDWVEDSDKVIETGTVYSIKANADRSNIEDLLKSSQGFQNFSLVSGKDSLEDAGYKADDLSTIDHTKVMGVGVNDIGNLVLKMDHPGKGEGEYQIELALKTPTSRNLIEVAAETMGIPELYSNAIAERQMGQPITTMQFGDYGSPEQSVETPYTVKRPKANGNAVVTYNDKELTWGDVAGFYKYSPKVMEAVINGAKPITIDGDEYEITPESYSQILNIYEGDKEVLGALQESLNNSLNKLANSKERIEFRGAAAAREFAQGLADVTHSKKKVDDEVGLDLDTQGVTDNTTTNPYTSEPIEVNGNTIAPEASTPSIPDTTVTLDNAFVESDYDYTSAKKAGMSPDSTGHYGSRVPSGGNEGLILKSETHPTFSKTVAGEKAAGNTLFRNKDNGRLYSFPNNPDSTKFAEYEYKPTEYEDSEGTPKIQTPEKIVVPAEKIRSTAQQVKQIDAQLQQLDNEALKAGDPKANSLDIDSLIMEGIGDVFENAGNDIANNFSTKINYAKNGLIDAATSLLEGIVPKDKLNDITNLKKLSVSETAKLASNALYKATGLGNYTPAESTISLKGKGNNDLSFNLNSLIDLPEERPTLDIENVPFLNESERPSIPEESRPLDNDIIGNPTYVGNGYEVRPYMMDLTDGLPVELAYNYHDKSHSNKPSYNSNAILGATHSKFEPVKKSFRSSYPIQIGYKDNKLQIIKTSDVTEGNQIIPLSNSVITKVSDLDIERSGDGYIINTAKDNVNGTTIIKSKSGNGKFHIGLAPGTRAGQINSQDINEFATLRGGMVIISTDDASASMVVSGSPKNIFEALANMEDKFPGKELYMFRGDTGTFNTPRFKNGNITAEDLKDYSLQNTWGKTQFLLLNK